MLAQTEVHDIRWRRSAPLHKLDLPVVALGSRIFEALGAIDSAYRASAVECDDLGANYWKAKLHTLRLALNGKLLNRV